MLPHGSPSSTLLAKLLSTLFPAKENHTKVPATTFLNRDDGKIADRYADNPDEALPLPPEGGADGGPAGPPTLRPLAHCFLLLKRRATATGSSSEPLLSEELSPKARGLW